MSWLTWDCGVDDDHGPAGGLVSSHLPIMAPLLAYVAFESKRLWI